MATNNITGLRDELLTVFDKLRHDNIDASKAGAMCNAAGKIISSAKVQLEYAKQTKTVPNIAFLKGD